MVSEANSFVSALMLARSESVKRGVPVSLCKSANQASCTASGTFEQGWLIFVDPNSDGNSADSLGTISVSSGAEGVTVKIPSDVTNFNYISFNPTGFLGFPSYLPELDLESGDATRTVAVSLAGRAYVK